MGRSVWVVVAAVLMGLGWCAYTRPPSYERSAFKMIVAAETYVHGPDKEMSEADVQKEVDLLLALKPSAPAPARVVLYEVPSSGESRIVSARKVLLLHKETSERMKDELEKTGLFEGIDFLPETYLPAGSPSLKTLRMAAARAQADGLLLYSTETGYDYQPNALSILYLTIVGVFIVPGSEGASLALSKAVLVDVKTGFIYRVLESYGEERALRPAALLNEEELEFEARKKALGSLAALTAQKVKELAAAKK